MVDHGTFRRINPNYPISILEPEGKDILTDSESDDDDDPDESQGCTTESSDKEKEPKPKKKWVKNEETDTYHCLDVPADKEGNVIQQEDIEGISGLDESGKRDEPVIVSLIKAGSSIQDITWDETAFGSIILPENQNQNVKSLTANHVGSSKTNIDDIIKGS